MAILISPCLVKRSNVIKEFLNIESIVIVVGVNIIHPAHKELKIQVTLVNKARDFPLCITCIFVAIESMIYLQLGTKYLIKSQLRIEEFQLSMVTRLGSNVLFEEFLCTWWYKYSTGIIICSYCHCSTCIHFYSSWILHIVSRTMFCVWSRSTSSFWVFSGRLKSKLGSYP